MAQEFLRVAFALIGVLGLIGMGALALRHFRHLAASGGLVRERRLALVETLSIDAKRRLAIVRCDDKEHLVILGSTSESVIASEINTPALLNDSTNPFSRPLSQSAPDIETDSGVNTSSQYPIGSLTSDADDDALESSATQEPKPAQGLSNILKALDKHKALAAFARHPVDQTDKSENGEQPAGKQQDAA